MYVKGIESDIVRKNFGNTFIGKKLPDNAETRELVISIIPFASLANSTSDAIISPSPSIPIIPGIKNAISSNIFGVILKPNRKWHTIPVIIISRVETTKLKVLLLIINTILLTGALQFDSKTPSRISFFSENPIVQNTVSTYLVII